jgi:hypothetical protein
MAQRIVAACAGLAKDPSPLVTGPQGGLRIAENVIIDRPGVARQRPGLEAKTTYVTSNLPQRMHAYNGTTILVAEGSLSYGVRVLSSGTVITAPTGGATPLSPSDSYVQFVDARGNCYWSSSIGVVKITSAADTTAELAGMHEALSCDEVSISTSGTPVAMPNNTARAWRWCHVKRDVNGVVVRSAPSPWASFENTTGSTVDINWVIPLPTYVVAGDEIELYATETVASGSTPSDMMYLTKRQVITAANVTAGSVTVKDSRADADLGAELYTNPTREGILKANGLPPACGAIAQWSDCVWFGRTKGPWTSALELVDLDGATVADGSVGFQVLTLAGIGTTNGSPTLTGFASTDSIEVGMRVTGTGIPNYPTLVTVLSKTATTVTMSSNATATAAVAVTFADGITIGSQTYYGSTANFIGPATTPGTLSTFDVVGESRTSAVLNLAYVINMANRVEQDYFAYAFSDPFSPTRAYIVIRAIDQSAAQFTVTTTRTAALSFDANSSGGILVDRDDRPNGLMYSKPDEPEHVPEINYLTVGSENDAIIALAPLRSALVVFKTDGIFRVTGSAPDGWRVDAIAPVVRPLRAECVSIMGEVAVCWSQHGVLLVDEGGVRNISDGLVGEDLETVERAVIQTPGVNGAFVATNNHQGYTLLGYTADSGAYATELYCYHHDTRAWTTWDVAAYCAVEARNSAAFYIARATGWGVSRVRNTAVDALNAFKGYDASHSISAWTYDSSVPSINVTTAQRGNWTPKANDWVSATVGASTEYRRITTAVDLGASYGLTLASAFSGTPGSSFVAYEGIVSTIQWQSLTPGSPQIDGLWREVGAQIDWSRWDSSIGVGGSTGRLLIGGTSNVQRTVSTTEFTEDREALPSDIARATVPIALSRCSHLYPYVATSDIGLDWRVLGVVLTLEAASERTKR